MIARLLKGSRGNVVIYVSLVNESTRDGEGQFKFFVNVFYIMNILEDERQKKYRTTLGFNLASLNFRSPEQTSSQIMCNDV